jgi:Kef-type K+ transport system membrane component KefB
MLLAGGLAEWVGAHAFLGAFLMGAAFGNGGNEVNRGQETMLQSVASFFAPLYFVSMGLNADFIRDFQPSLAGTLLVAACGSKFVGVLAGAWVSGLGLGRRSVAIGFGLNARGATGLVLAGVGLEYGLVGRPLFVALVLVSVITSVIAVPALQRLAVPHPAPASPARDGSSEPFHPARAIDR